MVSIKEQTMIISSSFQVSDVMKQIESIPRFNEAQSTYYYDKHARQVWNIGKVPKLLKLYTDRDGYKYWVIRSKTHRRMHISASHLAMEANDCPRPSPDHHADHINGDINDNRIENLRWLHKSENRPHPGVQRNRLTDGQVAMLRLDQQALDQGGNLIMPLNRLAKSFRVTPRTVSDALRRKTYKDVEAPVRQPNEDLSIDLATGKIEITSMYDNDAEILERLNFLDQMKSYVKRRCGDLKRKLMQ